MSTTGRVALLLALVAATAILPSVVQAHSGLRFSAPLDGATLGDSPTAVVLTFWEKPEPSLSSIRVVDTGGVAYHGDRPQMVEGDPLSLKMPIKRLGRGVYTVHWRVVSAVDGHASAGTFVFGVLVAPTEQSRTITTSSGPGNYLEGGVRAIYIAGVILLLGAAAATLARIGGNAGMRLAVPGWILSAVGLLTLAWVQRRAADVPLAQLLGTAVGRGLIWRAAALAAAGIAVAAALAARRKAPERTRPAAAVVAIATLVAIVAHSATGHAAAVAGWARTAIAVHTVHFAAVAVWLGGLSALIISLRRATDPVDGEAVRRFSSIAAIGITLVAITGALRTVNEIGAVGELITTPYGRVLGVKIILFVAIAALGAWNRWRHVSLAESEPGRLRRGASIELAVAAVVVAAAGLLGALAPPAASRAIAGIVATAEDFATTVRVRFSAASDQPGPNRFELHVVDFDTREAVRDARIRLQFTPVDDPRVQPSVLSLTPTGDGTYTGSGANVTFDGRWRITALIERASGSVSVPTIVETRGPAPFVSVLRPPGEQPIYTITVKRLANVRVVAEARHGTGSTLHVTFFNGILEPMPVDDVVVTVGTGATARQLDLKRTGTNTFVVLAAPLERGNNRIGIIAHTASGNRIHTVFNMPIDY